MIGDSFIYEFSLKDSQKLNVNERDPKIKLPFCRNHENQLARDAQYCVNF